MSAKAARQYNLNQITTVVNCIERILIRINKSNYPVWLLKELETASHYAQCTQQEQERVIKGFQNLTTGEEDAQSKS